MKIVLKKSTENSYFNRNGNNSSSSGRIGTFGSTNFDPVRHQIEFEEVNQPNVFIDEIRSKFECLNPNYKPPDRENSSKKLNAVTATPIPSPAASSSKPKPKPLLLLPPSPSMTLPASPAPPSSSNSSSTNGSTSPGAIKNRNNNINNTNIPQLPQPKHVIYQKELIQPGWRQKLPVGCGFINIGNSCYMNATLQALFHIPAFVNWLLNDETHRTRCQKNILSYQNCIVCAMYTTLKSTLNPHQSCCRPTPIYTKLKGICKHFAQGRQEDAHEFLRYLLEAMERSYLATLGASSLDNRSKETSPLGQIFGGYIRTEVTCLNCKHLSTTFQPLAELQLDIRHSTTVEDAVSNHFKRERLDNNDYRCDKCRIVGGAVKQFSLEVPPVVLCLQLKRFNLLGMKLSKPLLCSKTLNLTKFLHPSANGNNQALNYRLTSLITHIGSSPNCGHYTAIAKASNSNMYLFDDSCVRVAGSSEQISMNNNAYVIIYELFSGTTETKTIPSSSKYFPIFKKITPVKAWDENGNSKSTLNQSIESDRKRVLEKTREELEDEEFDSMKSKKPKRDESSKSRSSSRSREGSDSDDKNTRPSSFNSSSNVSYRQGKGSEVNGNKFQLYEDRRRLVNKMTVPSNSIGNSNSNANASTKPHHSHNGNGYGSSRSSLGGERVNRDRDSGNYSSSFSDRHSSSKHQQSYGRNFYSYGHNRFNNNFRKGGNNRPWHNGGSGYRSWGYFNRNPRY